MKTCCEEMKEFVNSLKSVPHTVCLEEVENDPAELLIKLEEFIPNIIFRFCPYCGTALAEVAENTGVPFVDRLRELIFAKEVNEPSTLSCRNLILETLLEDVKKLYNNEAPKLMKQIRKT